MIQINSRNKICAFLGSLNYIRKKPTPTPIIQINIKTNIKTGIGIKTTVTENPFKKSPYSEELNNFPGNDSDE